MSKLYALVFLILSCASFFVNGTNMNVAGWALLILANMHALTARQESNQ